MFGAIGDVRMDDLVMVDMTGIVMSEHAATNRSSTATSPSRPNGAGAVLETPSQGSVPVGRPIGPRALDGEVPCERRVRNDE